MNEKLPDYVLKNTRDSLQLIYLTFAAGALTLGFTTVVGAAWLYFEKDRVDDVLASHVKFLFNTFWKGGVLLFASALLSFFVLGFLILVFWFFWLIIRAIRGFRALRAGDAIENPKRWLF